MLKLPCLSVALLLLVAAAPGAGAAEERLLPAGEAEGLLRRPAAMDADSTRIVARAEAAYRKLHSLRAISRDGGLIAIAEAQKPRLFRLTQKLVSGEAIGAAVSDGARYVEYRERSKQYLERDASVLDQLALPVHVRLFFAAQRTSNLLLGLNGKPSAREYGYRYRGKAPVNGKPTERVDVSIMVRAPDGVWHSFTSERYFDPKSGLLVRAVNGGRTMDIENVPNARIPAGQFRWTPPAGAIKGLG